MATFTAIGRVIIESVEMMVEADTEAEALEKMRSIYKCPIGTVVECKIAPASVKRVANETV